MIQNLHLENFKVHKSADFNLKGLTILTGMNGMGKSSVIQALLLLRQSFLIQKKFNGIILNGDLVKIGNYQDAFCESGEGDEILFSLNMDNGTMYDLSFERNVDKNFLPLKNSVREDDLFEINLFKNNFQYIAAEHSAAQESNDRNTFYVEQLNQISEKHGDGKYTVHFLSHNSNKHIISKKLAHPNEQDMSLGAQTEAWLQEISPSVKLNIKEELSLNTFTLRYQFKTSLGLTKEYKPENVGFGVSYVLPVLVAILSAEPGALLLIENPEAHLHPAGQATMGKLLCLAAQCGVQLVVETHSDHIVNAILVLLRKDIKQKETEIDLEKIHVYFIERNKESHISDIYPIQIRPDARITNAPNMFFDQFSKDMKLIMGF
ncbi:DUF3696 domain-containing protein [Hymenobacter sp. UYP22]|uniref:DUF3696 domain-containing protein n=1 Tax=Hymenobacter sp. UYP22 TaxID=3156348 RepID=UPI003399E859